MTHEPDDGDAVIVALMILIVFLLYVLSIRLLVIPTVS